MMLQHSLAPKMEELELENQVNQDGRPEEQFLLDWLNMYCF